MHKKYFITIFLLFIGIVISAQVKTYKLINKSNNCDINYKAIYSIDTTTSQESRRNIFVPINGKFTLYTFINAYKRISYDNTEKEFHDIIVIKVDKHQKIIDGFQYTLEWAEKPFKYDLYKVEAKNIVINKKLPISKLKFQRVRRPKDRLNESAIIDF